MKWYFAYNAYTEEAQFPLIRMAVNSARRYTNLQPNCIISGPPAACSAWLEKQGVRVHFRDIRILAELFANAGFKGRGQLEFPAWYVAYVRLVVKLIVHLGISREKIGSAPAASITPARKRG